jgi:hypothetical protein
MIFLPSVNYKLIELLKGRILGSRNPDIFSGIFQTFLVETNNILGISLYFQKIIDLSLRMDSI